MIRRPKILNSPQWNPPNRSLTIEEINQFKPNNSKVVAIRFDGKYTTPKGASFRRVVCKCECGVLFSTLVSSVVQGSALSCGCNRINSLKRAGFTIEDINKKKPEASRLTAIKFIAPHIYPGGQPAKKVEARCVCGAIVNVFQADIVSGHTQSCGCYNMEVLLRRNTKYTQNIPKLWHCWNDMMRRCYDQTSGGYYCYGERGVEVCKDWWNYQYFLDWAVLNGWKEGLQLDKDIISAKIGVPALLYSPERCCFVTPLENSNNTRQNVKYEYGGSLLSVTQIAKKTGITTSKLFYRINKINMPLTDAIAIGNKRTNKWETKKYRV